MRARPGKVLEPGLDFAGGGGVGGGSVEGGEFANGVGGFLLGVSFDEVDGERAWSFLEGWFFGGLGLGLLGFVGWLFDGGGVEVQGRDDFLSFLLVLFGGSLLLGAELSLQFLSLAFFFAEFLSPDSVLFFLLFWVGQRRLYCLQEEVVPFNCL